MFKNYLKTALRNLSRNKIYSFINIAGLSLGLSCAMLILLYVKDEVSYDRFQEKLDKTFLIGRNIISNATGKVDGTDGYTGYLQGPELIKEVPGIESFVRLQLGQKNYKLGNDILSQQVYFVDSNFFSAFSFPLIQGNAKTALTGIHSVVISENLATKLFGTTDVLGKVLQMDGDDGFVPIIVSAVAKNCPINSTIKFDMLLPLKVSAKETQSAEAWNTSILNTFVVLNGQAERKTVEAGMKRISEVKNSLAGKLLADKSFQKMSSIFVLQPFRDMHLSGDYRAYELSDASSPTFSYILSAIAFFILIIACINFVNLTIARSAKRAKEIGVRKVVGGERKQLMMQFLGESFLLCFISFLAAIVVVQLILPLFNDLSGKALSLSYLLDAKLVTGYICLFIVTAFLAGFYPALILSAYNPVQILYSRFALSGKKYLQKALVILQFTLASFLIIATFTIVSQFNYLTSKELGYDDQDLVIINNWGMTTAEVNLFRQELMKTPGIAAVSSKDMGWDNGNVKVDNGNEVPYVRETVDENFIPLMKVPLVQGRNFSKEYGSDSAQALLVNETFARQAGWKQPVGKEIALGHDNPEKFTVIGVVKDYYYQPLNEVIKAQIFTLKPGRVLGNLLVRIGTENRASSLQQIEKVFKQVFPLAAWSYFFKDQENLRYYAAEAKWKEILIFSAILTIFISCIGLFGLSVLSAEKRTKEIGIRKILGASTGVLVVILSKDFLKLVLVALLVSVPLTWIGASKWLDNYPNRINLGWGLFALAALLVVAVALVTVSFQAFKAAVSNPVKSLRSE